MQQRYLFPHKNLGVNALKMSVTYNVTYSRIILFGY